MAPTRTCCGWNTAATRLAVTGPVSPILIGIRSPALFCQSNDVTDVRDAGPSLGKDGAGVGVNLGEADGAPSGTLKPNVSSADA